MSKVMTFTINNKCLLKNTFTEVHTLSHSVRNALPTRHGRTRHSNALLTRHGNNRTQNTSMVQCTRAGAKPDSALYNIVNSYARFFPGPGRRSSNCHSTSTLVFNTLLLVVCELFHV
jgi:hypothetical protein